MFFKKLLNLFDNKYCLLASRQGTLLVSVVFLLVVMFLSLFYTQNMRAALGIVNAKNAEIEKNIINNVSSSLKNISLHLAVLANSNQDEDVLKSRDVSARIMWEQLNGDPNIASIFMGDKYGNFLQARRTPALAIREIRVEDGKAVDFWEFKNRAYNTIKTQSTVATFDARTRVWYQNANENGKFYWTDPYIFASTGAMGITVAIPSIDKNGEKQKVSAADFTLETIAKILKAQSVAAGGELVLFSENKDVISASFAYETNSSGGKLTTVDKLANQKVNSAYLKIIDGELNGEVSDPQSKEIFIYSTSKFPTIFGKKWYLTTFISKTNATVDVKHSLYIAIAEIIGVFILIASSAIFWGFKNNRIKKELADSSILMKKLLDSLPNPIFYKDKDGRFTGFNKAYETAFGVDSRGFIGKTVMDLEHLPPEDRQKYNAEDMALIQEGSALVREQEMIFVDAKTHHTLYSVNGFHDSDGKPGGLIGIFTDITEQKKIMSELALTKQTVEAIHKQTKESIEYASFIQHALIPSNTVFRRYFKEYFAIWRPKDIVGGDVYFFEELLDGEACILMVIDCTGHGVHGAFLTMLIKAIESQVVASIKYSDEEVSPAKILSFFNKSLKRLLMQDDEDSIINAGFDGGIVYYNKRQKIIKFAGARTPLFYVENGELKTIKGDKNSIGYKNSDISYEFTDYVIKAQDGMCCYITTDGYHDQNGGAKGFPFGKTRFTNIIKEYHAESFADQQEIFLEELFAYQGSEARNDDITLIGFRI